mmetsp:Transcript_19863/g.67118  ORF Transcript_19863/g.67118 Transcript_19863/m.67118 type:complete len:539 (-) Transcript_19863:190-1806(-)
MGTRVHALAPAVCPLHDRRVVGRPVGRSAAADRAPAAAARGALMLQATRLHASAGDAREPLRRRGSRAQGRGGPEALAGRRRPRPRQGASRREHDRAAAAPLPQAAPHPRLARRGGARAGQPAGGRPAGGRRRRPLLAAPLAARLTGALPGGVHVHRGASKRDARRGPSREPALPGLLRTSPLRLRHGSFPGRRPEPVEASGRRGACERAGQRALPRPPARLPLRVDGGSPLRCGGRRRRRRGGDGAHSRTACHRRRLCRRGQRRAAVRARIATSLPLAVSRPGCALSVLARSVQRLCGEHQPRGGAVARAEEEGVLPRLRQHAVGRRRRRARPARCGAQRRVSGGAAAVCGEAAAWRATLSRLSQRRGGRAGGAAGAARRAAAARGARRRHPRRARHAQVRRRPRPRSDPLPRRHRLYVCGRFALRVRRRGGARSAARRGSRARASRAGGHRRLPGRVLGARRAAAGHVDGRSGGADGGGPRTHISLPAARRAEELRVVGGGRLVDGRVRRLLQLACRHRLARRGGGGTGRAADGAD